MYRVICKLIGLILLVVLCSGAVTACSTGEDNDLKKLDLVNTKDLKTVTLTFYFCGTEKDNTKNVLKELQKSASKLKIKLNFEWYEENFGTPPYEGRVLNALASNLPLDGFYLADPKDNYYFDYAKLIENGSLKDISSMIKQYAPNIYKKLTPEQLDSATVNGKLFAVPSLYPRAKVMYALVREDLRQKYNLPEIKTYTDYENYMKTIKNNESGITTPLMLNNNLNSMMLFANLFSYNVLNNEYQLVYKHDDPKMKILPWEQTPEFSQAAKRLISWTQKGYMVWAWDDTTLHENRFDTNLKIQLEFLMGHIASTLTYQNNADWLNAKQKSNWKFKAYPLISDIKVQRESPINGCIAFNANSPNVERALMFLDWVQSSQENYDLLMYGRKGIDYNLNGQNYAFPNGESEETSLYLGWQGRDAFMNPKYERNPDGVSEDYNKEYMDLINNNTEYTHIIGFRPDLTKINKNSRIDYLNQQIDLNLRNGVYPPGSVDPDTVDALKSDTKNIIEEIQSQLDGWSIRKKQASGVH